MKKLTAYQKWVIGRLEDSPTAILLHYNHPIFESCILSDPPYEETIRISTFRLLQPYLEQVGQAGRTGRYRPKRPETS